MAKWQQKYRVDWDATWRSSADSLGNFDGNRKVQWESKGRRSRSLGLGLGLGEFLRAGQSPCGVGLGDALQLPEEDTAGALWVLRAPEASAVRRMCGGAAPDHHGYLARIEVELLMMKRPREDVFFFFKKGPKLSVNENGKEGKSKMIASCGFLEEELRQCSKEDGVTMADSVETLGVDLRTRGKNLGAKEKARRMKCKVRFSPSRGTKPSRRTS